MAKAWIEIDDEITVSEDTLDALDTYRDDEVAVFFEGFDPLTLEKDGIVTQGGAA